MSTTEPIRLERTDHVAHFYRDDAELARTVGAHLFDALRGGAAVIVIATRSHLRLFEEELAAAGIDVASAIEHGSLTPLDAHATLAELMPRDRISREAFHRVVGNLVRRARVGGVHVCACGEMVDLLWRAGDVPGAIELEGLWNELIAELQFSLLCAYHSEAVQAPEHEHALQEVCRLHNAVSSPDEVSRQFEPREIAPLAARRFFDEALQRWGRGGPPADDARVVLSELVTNAVVHARSPLSVSIRRKPSRLRLSVRDESMALPEPRRTAPTAATGGRGLALVAALARDWGVKVTTAGKTVWVEL